MSDVRRLVGLLVATLGLGSAAFGVMRGLSNAGPAQGTRLIVAIDPPLDAAVIHFAQQAARDRLDSIDTPVRVVAAGEQLVVEIPEQAPEIVAGDIALLERTAHVELATGGTTVDARTLRRIDIVDQGVAAEASAPVPFKLGESITFALDGKITLAASPDRVDGAAFHVPMASGKQTAELESLLVAGAAHAMHVTHREPFTRATGFLPRAWLFLTIGGVLLLAGGFVAARKR